MLLMLLLARLC